MLRLFVHFRISQPVVAELCFAVATGLPRQWISSSGLDVSNIQCSNCTLAKNVSFRFTKCGQHKRCPIHLFFLFQIYI